MDSARRRRMSDDDDFDRAQAIFVAERILETPTSRRLHGAGDDIGMADLVGFLEGDPAIPATVVNRALMRRPALRADLAALRARLGRFDMPRVAAASDGALEDRPLPGGRLSIYVPDDEPRAYVSVTIDDRPPEGLAFSLVLSVPDGAILSLPLPEFDDEGVVLVILDPADAADSAVLEALRNPLTQGTFIERRRPSDD